MKTNWTDEQIIAMIKKGEKERNQALRHVFERLDWKGAVRGHILGQGGNPDDAHEAAVRALLAFCENIQGGQFEHKSSLKTYFTRIAYNQWLKLLRGRKTHEDIDEHHELNYEVDIEDYMANEAQEKYYEMVIGVLGEECKKVFLLRGMGFQDEVIAIRLNLKNADMAKKKFFRCRQKFTAYIDEHPQWRELLNR